MGALLLHPWLPTRNVGTWLPGSPKPWCNNTECARLSTEVWPEMWKRGHGTVENWRLRQEKECAICKQERKRRCCVLRPRNTEDHQKLQEAPFDAAPFVHPFRHPSYHATQLRAITFAKCKQTRLYWVAAYDKVVTGSLANTPDREELRKDMGCQSAIKPFPPITRKTRRGARRRPVRIFWAPPGPRRDRPEALPRPRQGPVGYGFWTPPTAAPGEFLVKYP